MSEKFTVMRGFSAVLLCLLVAGCSAPYRASFVAVIGDAFDPKEELPIDGTPRPPVSGAVMVQVFESTTFWTNFVVPQLPDVLKQDTELKRGMKFSAREDKVLGGKVVSTFDVRLKRGGEVAFDALLRAYRDYVSQRLSWQLEDTKERLTEAKARLTASRDEEELLRNSRAVARSQELIAQLESTAAKQIVLRITKP